MREWQSQSHVRWYCRYHVVWVPKYRKRVIFGEMRSGIGRIVWELCQRQGVELVEGHALSDHVHVLLGIPPKFSVANTVGFLKGKSAIRIHRGVSGAATQLHGLPLLGARVLRQHGRVGRRGHPRLHPEAGSRGKETRKAGTRPIEGPFEGPSSYRPLRGR